MRVQIPAYTDWWMRGARFGEVVKTSRKKFKLGVRAQLLTLNRFEADREIAHVKLDANGKVIHVVLADCQEV